MQNLGRYPRGFQRRRQSETVRLNGVHEEALDENPCGNRDNRERDEHGQYDERRELFSDCNPHLDEVKS